VLALPSDFCAPVLVQTPVCGVCDSPKGLLAAVGLTPMATENPATGKTPLRLPVLEFA